MCDGCRLSFHGGCIGYQDLGFLPEDEDWLCWNCSKRLGKEFVVDARPLDPGCVPNVVFVAVNDRLEYYYKFNVVRKKGKRGRRLAVTLRTGPDAERDVIETTFDVEDRKIWRGDLSRNTTNGWPDQAGCGRERAPRVCHRVHAGPHRKQSPARARQHREDGCDLCDDGKRPFDGGRGP